MNNSVRSWEHWYSHRLKGVIKYIGKCINKLTLYTEANNDTRKLALSLLETTKGGCAPT